MDEKVLNGHRQRILALSDQELQSELTDLLTHEHLQMSWPGRGLHPLQRFSLIYYRHDSESGLAEASTDLCIKLRRSIITILDTMCQMKLRGPEYSGELILNLGDLIASLDLVEATARLRTLVFLLADSRHRGYHLGHRLMDIIDRLSARQRS